MCVCEFLYSKKRIELNLNSTLKPQGASDPSWKINRSSSRCHAAVPPCTMDNLDRIANVCSSAIILTQLTNLNLTQQLLTAQARFRCIITKLSRTRQTLPCGLDEFLYSVINDGEDRSNFHRTIKGLCILCLGYAWKSILALGVSHGTR